MIPTEDTPIGATVVFNPPGTRMPIEERPRYTFLGIVADDAEPGEYCWIADRPANTPLQQVAPTVTPEITADLLLVES